MLKNFKLLLLLFLLIPCLTHAARCGVVHNRSTLVYQKTVLKRHSPRLKKKKLKGLQNKAKRLNEKNMCALQRAGAIGYNLRSTEKFKKIKL